MSDAIKFVVNIHPRSTLLSTHQTTLTSLVSDSICVHLAVSPQSTAVRSLAEKTFYRAKKERLIGDRNSCMGKLEIKSEWDLARKRSKERVEEWHKSGLNPSDFVKLVEIVKLGGRIPSR